MTLKEMPKVGENVRYLGGLEDINIDDITEDNTYKIRGIDDEGFTYYFDDSGDRWFITKDAFAHYELVANKPEQASEEHPPSVADILANLALRVSELERHNREQAYEINELYKEVSR